MGLNIRDFEDSNQDVTTLKQKIIDLQIDLKNEKDKVKQLEEVVNKQSFKGLDELDDMRHPNLSENVVSHQDLFNLSQNRTFIIT